MTDVHPNLVVKTSKAQNILFTKLRDENTTPQEFVKFAKRSMRILIEDVLAELPTKEVEVNTPCGTCYGLKTVPPMDQVCAVSIVRSGHCLLENAREVEPDLRTGLILIQRDEGSIDKTATYFYSKLPPGVANMHVILCDPMIATGNSALGALDVLVLQNKVDPANIIFANMICTPEGLKAIGKNYPKVKIVTVVVDTGLNADKFVVPGLGDFGDRYFNTL